MLNQSKPIRLFFVQNEKMSKKYSKKSFFLVGNEKSLSAKLTGEI